VPANGGEAGTGDARPLNGMQEVTARGLPVTERFTTNCGLSVTAGSWYGMAIDDVFEE
jgi:hypothetical protein